MIIRDNIPSASCVQAAQELARLAVEFHSGCRVVDLKIKDVEYLDRVHEKQQLKNVLDQFDCTGCPQFKEHVRS
jgi:hypothetical protein